MTIDGQILTICVITSALSVTSIESSRKDYSVTNRTHRFTFSLLFAATLTLLVVGKAGAQATGDIQINVSTTDVCDGSVPAPQSFVVYTKNNNTSRPISATLQYNTAPSSQSFSVYDVGLTPSTDTFPKSLVVRVPAGATVPVGCTYTYRTSPSTNQVSNIQLVVTLTGAAYISPNDPPLPAEDARSFTSFMIRGGFSACGGNGGRPAGLTYLVNMHPYAHLTATIALLGNTSEIGLDVPPLSAQRVGCSNGNGSPVSVRKASLVYPAGQPGAHARQTKPNSPF
jgi:hypothetical protein